MPQKLSRLQSGMFFSEVIELCLIETTFNKSLNYKKMKYKILFYLK